MFTYRCFFLDGEDHIKASKIVEADAIDDVIDKACALLRERHQHRAVEIWEGERRPYHSGERGKLTGRP